MPESLAARLDRRCYPNLCDNWDNQLFREEIVKRLRPEMTLLDIGAGAGIIPQMNFKGMAGTVHGLDPDPVVKTNPWLDHAVVGNGEKMPMFWDGQFDVVVCCNVLEHVAAPLALFSEVRRILKKGGWFLAKTTNRYHYVSLLAQATPLWFHQTVNRLRGQTETDNFPTFFRANTRRKQRALADQAGLKVISMNAYEGRPEYLRWNAFTYLPGILYERLVNGSNLSFAKLLLISVFQA